MKYIIIVCGLLTFTNVVQAKNLNFVIERMGSLYCQGKNQEILKIANEAKPSDEHYVAARLYSLVDDATLLKAISEYDNAVKNISNLSEVERLYYAAASERTHHGTVANLEAVADFKSSFVPIEAHRLAFQGSIALIKGNHHLAAMMYQEAFDKNSYTDLSFLEMLFELAQSETYSEDLMRPYYSAVDQFPDSAVKHFFLAIIAKVKKGKEFSSYYSHIKSAYEICPKSQIYAFEYAYSLLMQRDTLGAEKVLLEIANSQKYYSPIVDFYLARIYFRMHDFPKAEKFINHASENANLADARGQLEIVRWKKDGRRIMETDDLAAYGYAPDDSYLWVIYGILGGIGLLAISMFLRYRKNRNNPPLP